MRSAAEVEDSARARAEVDALECRLLGLVRNHWCVREGATEPELQRLLALVLLLPSYVQGLKLQRLLVAAGRCARVGLPFVEQVFSAFCAASPEPSIKAYRALLSAYRLRRRFAEGLDLFAVMRRDPRVRLSVADFVLAADVARAHLRSAEESQALLLQMQGMGLRPPPFMFHCVMGALRRARNWEGCFRVYEEMRGAKVFPNHVTYATLMHACYKAGDLQRALRLLADMDLQAHGDPSLKHPRPEVITPLLLLIAEKNAGPQFALQLYGKYASALPHDEPLLDALRRVCVAAGDAERAGQLARQIARNEMRAPAWDRDTDTDTDTAGRPADEH